MSGRAKTKIFPLMAAIALVVTSAVSAIALVGLQADQDDRKAVLTGVQREVTQAQTTMDQLQASASLENFGAESGRVRRDTDTIADLVDRSLTWDSNASYVEARESTMRTYGLVDGDSFMVAFLPPAPVNRDDAGNEYPYIDAAGLNSQVGDFKARVLSVDGLDYRYLVLVDVQAKSSDGLGTAV
ncbi:hypothetical protein SAMN06295974_3695, partial [Plantibacter flavus]